MRGVHKVILIGNATHDLELRYAQNGKPDSSYRPATNRTVKGEEATQFHTIVCWDRLAETAKARAMDLDRFSRASLTDALASVVLAVPLGSSRG